MLYNVFLVLTLSLDFLLSCWSFGFGLERVVGAQICLGQEVRVS